MLAPAALFVLASLAAAPTAHAYCRDQVCANGPCAVDADGCPTGGKPMFWASRCVGYSFNPHFSTLPPEQVRGAVDAAFAAWSGVSCPGGGVASIELVKLPDVECTSAGYDPSGGNANSVLFLEVWPQALNAGLLEYPSPSADLVTGELLDLDVLVNLEDWGSDLSLGPGGVDVQWLVTHAVGHMLGLAHSSDPDATMAPGIAPGKLDGRSLSPDDVAAICAAYPPGRTAECDAEPRGGFRSTCPGEGGEGGEGPPQDALAGAGGEEGCGCVEAGRPVVGGRGALAVFGLALLRLLRRRSRPHGTSA